MIHDTFIVIIPSNELMVSRRYTSGFQSKGQRETPPSKKHCFHNQSKIHILLHLVLPRLFACIILSTFTVCNSSNTLSKSLINDLENVVILFNLD